MGFLASFLAKAVTEFTPQFSLGIDSVDIKMELVNS